MLAQKRLDLEWDWQVPVRTELFNNDSILITVDDKVENNIAVILTRTTDSYQCRINPFLSSKEQRLAYFLGLSIKELDLRVDEKLIFNYNRENFLISSFRHKKAMSFALDMLIPKDGLNYFTMKQKISDIGQLASLFDCSETHMIIQLEEKGFLGQNTFLNVF